MNKELFILQTPIPLSFDIPKINTYEVGKPIEIYLTEQEVEILKQSVPGIKLVSKLVPVLIQEEKPNTENISSPEETSENKTGEDAGEVVLVVPAKLTLEETEKTKEPENFKVLSENLSVQEATLYLANLNSKEDLESFLSPEEDRKGVLEVYKKRLKELS